MVFVATHTIIQFIDSIIANNEELSILDFATQLRDNHYPDVELKFMNEFFELTDQKNDGQFIVHHQKLIDYGVVVSAQSTHVKDRLVSLGLIENEDFTLTDVRERNSNGIGSNKRYIYMLTPESFFLALQRAQRRPHQLVDPTIYA